MRPQDEAEPAITREVFERSYGRPSGLTVARGYELGIFPAVRCDCGSGLCQGWRRRYEDDGPS